MKLRIARHIRIGFGPALASVLVAGCASPLYDNPDKELRQSVADSVKRELADAQTAPEYRTLTRQSRVASLELKPEVLKELETMAGPKRWAQIEPPLGPSLLGGDQQVVQLTLQRAITMSVQNNLNVQFARLAPAIAETQVTSAEAAFDWVFFSNFNWSETNEPRTQSAIGGSLIGLSSDQRQVVSDTIGIRRAMVTGGQIQIQHEFQYTDVATPNLTTVPDPARESNVVLQIDQPLLRNFGSEATLSQVRLNRNSERDEIESLRADLLKTVTDTETAYWNLYLAYENLKIVQELLDRGIEVRAKVKQRLAYDATPAQYADAVARVEGRRSDVIRAQKTLRDASDKLKLLMNDPELTIGSVVLLLPSDETIDVPIEYSFLDAVLTALERRPEVRRALLSIDNTSIRQQLADNARLPKLDMRFQTKFNSLGTSTSDAYDRLTDGHFVDYLLSLAFEQPIGNRDAEAAFRKRRLERMQAVLAYRNTIQGIVGEVKSALRSVVTNYTLIEQTRTARVAAAENLRTLVIEEGTIAELTAEFLAEKLRRQEALASAEQQEAQALVDYNTSLANLQAAMGTALEQNNVLLDIPDVEDIAPGYRLFPEYRGVGGGPAKGAAPETPEQAPAAAGDGKGAESPGGKPASVEEPAPEAPKALPKATMEAGDGSKPAGGS